MCVDRQCSECGSSSSEEQKSEVGVNPDAPRRLRDKIKEPVKFDPDKETSTCGVSESLVNTNFVATLGLLKVLITF